MRNPSVSLSGFLNNDTRLGKNLTLPSKNQTGMGWLSGLGFLLDQGARAGPGLNKISDNPNTK